MLIGEQPETVKTRKAIRMLVLRARSSDNREPDRNIMISDLRHVAAFVKMLGKNNPFSAKDMRSEVPYS